METDDLEIFDIQLYLGSILKSPEKLFNFELLVDYFI